MVGTQGFHLDAGIRLLAAQAVRIAVFACQLFSYVLLSSFSVFSTDERQAHHAALIVT